MQPPVAREDRQQRVNRTFIYSHRKPPASQATQLSQPTMRLLPHIQHPLGITQQKFAGVRQASGARSPHEQRFSRPFLQLSNGHADRRLRAKQTLRRSRKTLLLRHRRKYLQFIQIQKVLRSVVGAVPSRSFRSGFGMRTARRPSRQIDREFVHHPPLQHPILINISYLHGKYYQLDRFPLQGPNCFGGYPWNESKSLTLLSATASNRLGFP